ncbi:hypothetical protein KZ483_25895 [Paenibacillus sp. sptzw28]|uniref:hypothetical protein n=1 Tax=Paenibacillus sp. sptzw28 TaxID=715179 RepID=UPI001C6E31CF|nr:hypothetical protein [Paenibacillus sp. sptzw28]QYR21108.1 hypothetical protein KZ483_25895 [Paenibacillus sp. sptzw28]
MQVQLIACDEIKIEDNRHVLGKVINSVSVPVFPYIIKFSFLLKITELPLKRDVLTEFKIINAKGELLSSPSAFVHRNYRGLNQVPGVDQNFDFKLLVEREENIFFECYIDGVKRSWYPINISLY